MRVERMLKSLKPLLRRPWDGRHFVAAQISNIPNPMPPGFAARALIWSAPAERSDDGALAWHRGRFRRRGFFPAVSQSGVALRLPPHSIGLAAQSEVYCSGHGLRIGTPRHSRIRERTV